MNWNADDPIFRELFCFARFLYGGDDEAMHALEKAFHRLSGKPEAAEKERAARFLYARLHRGAPKAAKKSKSRVVAGDAEPTSAVSLGSMEKLRSLPEPERSLAGLFYATELPDTEISRILGLPRQDLARRLCALRNVIAPAGTDETALPAGRPTAADLESAFERDHGPEMTGAGVCSASFSKGVDKFWRSEFQKVLPNAKQSEVLAGWANHLQTRAASWRPSPRDPAMIGLALALVFLVMIVVWTLLGASEAFHGKSKVLAILDQGVSAAAAEYEPVSGNLADLGDWLALQGMEGFSPPNGFKDQQMVAARIFSFEGNKVASVLLPELEMAVFYFEAEGMEVEVKPVGKWKFVARDRDAAAILQSGRTVFMVAMRGSVEDLQNRIGQITAQ